MMEEYTTIQGKKKQTIDAIQPSDEILTSPAGFALFAQYLQSIQLRPIVERRISCPEISPFIPYPRVRIGINQVDEEIEQHHPNCEKQVDS